MTARKYALLDAALAKGLLPDPVMRLASKGASWYRERDEARGGVTMQERRLADLVAHKSTGPVAEVPAKANEQHYELPAEFMALILGPRRKYSGCYWPEGTTTIGEAEEAMLRLSCERAGVRDGMQILDLGCGWGALSLFLVQNFDVNVVGVSNSNRQREWIEAERDKRGLHEKLTIITADVNEFEPEGGFDLVMSVEMFEHMRNWKELLHRINSWLKPEGKLFIHIFTHRTLAYQFEGTWAAERFFTAGVMPSHDLMLHFADDFAVQERWAVDGTHYEKTLKAWLANLDAHKDEALRILEMENSPKEARRLFATWRLFLLSTQEIWGYKKGDAWLVSHYLMEPRS